MALLAVFSLAGGASAALFTLPGPFVIDGSNNAGSGVFGTIDPVTDLFGGLGFTSGITDFALTDVLAVIVTLDPGSASVGGIEFGSSAPLFGEPVGAGSFADVGDQAPGAVTHEPFDFASGGVGVFTFLPDQLDANETSVRLFATYTPGRLMGGNTVNFMTSSGSDFTVQPIIVPEPSTIALLALPALVALAVRRLGLW